MNNWLIYLRSTSKLIFFLLFFFIIWNLSLFKTLLHPKFYYHFSYLEYFWSLFIPVHVIAFRDSMKRRLSLVCLIEFLNSIISLNISAIIPIWLLACYFYTPPPPPVSGTGSWETGRFLSHSFSSSWSLTALGDRGDRISVHCCFFLITFLIDGSVGIKCGYTGSIYWG